MTHNPFNRRTSKIGQPQHLGSIRTPHESLPRVGSASYVKVIARQERINKWTDRATIPIAAGLIAVTAWAGYSYPIDVENCSFDLQLQKDQNTFVVDINTPDEC